jgi:FkbM family methyltransferase
MLMGLPRLLLRHWHRLAIYRAHLYKPLEVRRLRALPRYRPARTRLLGPRLALVDAASFLSAYHEIFEKQAYRFPASTPEPYIIDGGANIGLSVIFFKQLYPASRIVAFEPDPRIFAVLERNLQAFGLSDVTAIRGALWSAETTLTFAPDGADAGRILQVGGAGREVSGGDTTIIRALRLRNYLDEDVDLLKLDIEGAETDVLVDCFDRLHRVRRLFVEYHSFVEQPQRLHELIALLAKAGFRLHVHAPTVSAQPFVKRTTRAGFDLQLSLFAVRDASVRG